MKRLALLLLIAILIPQIALAAWWNPFSWKIFTRIFTPRTEVVEIIPIATSTDSDTEITEIEKLRAEVEELKKKESSDATKEKASAPVIQQPKTVTPATTIQPSQSSVNYDALYKDVNDKYFSLRNIIDNQIISLEESPSYNQTKTTYLNFLKELRKTLNADMKELTNIWNVVPKPANIVNTYVAKYPKLLNDYNLQKGTYDRYMTDLREIEEARAKATVQAEINTSNQEKQEKLDAINLQIANLNAKYAQDLKDLQGRGLTDVGYNAALQNINIQYNVNYNLLKAEYQQVLYSK